MWGWNAPPPFVDVAFLPFPDTGFEGALRVGLRLRHDCCSGAPLELQGTEQCALRPPRGAGRRGWAPSPGSPRHVRAAGLSRGPPDPPGTGSGSRGPQGASGVRPGRGLSRGRERGTG